MNTALSSDIASQLSAAFVLAALALLSTFLFQ